MNTLRDLHHAVRTLRRAWGTSLFAILIIALALGADVALFGVVRGVLLTPFPVTDPDDLVVMWKEDPSRGFNDAPVGYTEFELWKESQTVFTDIAGMASEGTWALNYEGLVEREGSTPEIIRVAPVTAGFFELLGVGAERGRTLLASEDPPNSDRVVLSHRVWQGRFGGDEEIVGKRVGIHGRAYTIVGVMPPELDFPTGVELWLPIGERPFEELDVIGRLRPETSFAAAHQQIQALSSAYSADIPFLSSQSVVASPLVETVVGQVRRPLWILLAAVGLVLLIACANVANLLLMRHRAHRRNFAIRAALGAGRWRLVRQTLTESALLVGLGGVLGVGLAHGFLALLRQVRPEQLPRIDQVHIDGTVLAFFAAILVLTVFACGLFPAFDAARSNLISMVQTSGGRGGRADRWSMGTLVVVEVALALVLLIGTGLLGRSLERYQEIDRGFVAENLISVSVPLPRSRYPDRAARLAALEQLEERFAALPGVTAVTPALTRPFARNDGWDAGILIEGQSADEAKANPWVNWEIVAPDYFTTLEIPLVAGRPFSTSDHGDAPRVAIVGQGMAERFWPGQDPVGQRLQLPPDDAWGTVVGVAAEVRYRHLTDRRLSLYTPVEQSTYLPQFLVVKSALPASAQLPLLARQLRAVDPALPHDLVSLEALLDAGLSAPRSQIMLLGAFAGVALILVALGLYAVIGTFVGTRTRELAVRRALGARRRQLLGLILRHGLGLTALGLVLGLGLGVAASRVMASLLYETSPLDLPTFIAVALFLLGVAAFAVYLPARRATTIEPMLVLKEE